ncbi:MAG: arginine--tRNA ligase, partial [Filifactor alocis]|nr:arginine--tRNA ligase [Filifactor alocis]
MDFKQVVTEHLKQVIPDMSESEIEQLIEVPPNPEMGDYSFPCFKLAKLYRKSPNQIAEDLAKQISVTDSIESVSNMGGYINFVVNKLLLATKVISSVLREGDNYGKCNYGQNRNVVVEYSSPNIAKPFHIGHIRSTAIGHAIDRIYEFIGFNTISVNHLGDYGTQFGKLIVAIRRWGDREEVAKNPINELLKLYSRFHEEAEEDPSLEDEAREVFHRLEEKTDQDVVDFWQWIRDVSMAEFNRVYKLLGIEYDSWAGESFYSDKMPAIVEHLEKMNLLKESQGAQIVDLEEFNMPPALIKKKDGSTLYITRDLAASKYRKDHYDFFKNIYVVGSPQELHFKQWKKVHELSGYDWANDCIHVAFGTISLEDGVLSTRKGRVVVLEDVLRKSIEKTKEIIQQKNPNLENLDKVAEQVGVGAIVFQELSNSRIKDYTFSWDRALTFEGETGPYTQYTHARCCSLLERGKADLSEEIDYSILAKNADAMNVIKRIDTFNEVLMRSANKYEPHHVTRFVLDVCQAFNKFYHDN